MRYNKEFQANLLLLALSFLIFGKIYWYIFNLISPQHTGTDIIAGFIFILVMVPATCGLKECIKRLLDNKGSQANLLLLALSFLIFWKIYWYIFNLITPQNTITDIIAGFIFILVMVPATYGLKECSKRLLDH